MALVPTDECRWLVHLGTRILVVAYGRCRTDGEMLQVLAEQVIQVKGAGGKVRMLHDYREAFLGEKFFEQAMRLSKERREAAFEKVAVIGLTGVKKALFQTYRVLTGDSTSRTFDTEDAALDWLAR